MLLMELNVWAVLAAGAATMAIGFLWYSPVLFARPWMVAMGYDPEDKTKLDEMRKGASRMYAITLLGSLLAAFVLGKILYNFTIDSALYGMKIALAVWAAFVLTVQLTDQMFGHRPFKLFLINTGYQLACYLVMGAILGKWAGA
jgi:uncharacterized protein DUF1761